MSISLSCFFIFLHFIKFKTPMSLPFGQVVIIGVGLIGGSMGLVFKQKGLATSVVGRSSSRES